MKNKRILFFSLAAFLSSSSLVAQTISNWKINGNALEANGKLGTTNAQNVNFITNNISRMSLTANGTLKINSDQTSIQFPNPGTTPKPMMFWYESGNINKARMIMAYSPAFPNFGLKTDGFNKLDFTDGSSTTLSVDLGAHNVGIGTTAPTAKLHVNSAAGEDAFRVQLNGVTQLKVATGGGVAIGGGSSAPVNGLSVFGNVAVGTTNPEIFKLKIIHDNNISSNGGLAIENSTLPGIEWEFFAGGGNGPLNLLRDKSFMGQFQFPSGQYAALSDERVKTNIRLMQPVLEKIKQLKPSNYQFKNATDKGDYDGFIAQDVMKIFPNLVTHTVDKESNKDVYLMNYSGFGVIAIKGIQELVKQNEEKDAKIESLQKQIDELKAIVLKDNKSNAAASATINTFLTDASFEQNVPNPVANSTSIGYNIPSIFSSAQIIITDKTGKTIKQLSISAKGKGVINVDASALSPGTYNYALVVDGKWIGSKQMIVAK
jgi:hypothetical protein